MSIQKKQIEIIVSDPISGNFITSLKNFVFNGFTKELNGGVGECVITLNEIFDYNGPEIYEGNDIEIRISDKDTIGSSNAMNTRTIYIGYISLIEREVNSSGKENCVIHCLGHYTKLELDILKDGTQTTLYSNSTDGLTTVSGDQDAADIGHMARAIMDRYNAENSDSKLGYDFDDVPNAAVTATYGFEQKTYREALNEIKEMMPAGVYYYFDELGKLKFKLFQTTTATHKFIFGRHFNNVKIERSMEKIRNFLLIWNGEAGADKVYKHYQSNDSIARYGRRTETLNNYGINDTDAADLIGEKFLAECSEPAVKIICSILDNNENANGYDIESVNPGDTCSFYGFDPTMNSLFRDCMIITKVSYFFDHIEMEIESVKAGITDFQEEQRRQINAISSGGFNVPESYT